MSSTHDNEPMTIPSFRLVFKIEHTLFRLGDWRIPLPYGLKLSTVGWATIALLVMLALSYTPLVGTVLGVAPWFVRYLMVPSVAAWAMTHLSLDGRSAPRFLRAQALYARQPRRIAAWRKVPAVGTTMHLRDTAVTRDIFTDALVGTTVTFASPRGRTRRRTRRHRPAHITLRYPCTVSEHGRTLTVTQTTREPQFPGARITIDPGHTVRIEGTEATR